MAEEVTRATKLAAAHLRLEDYTAFYNHPSAPSSLKIPQLQEIIHLHGYCGLHHSKKRRGHILEVLSGIENLLNPHRSTLNDTLSSCKACLTLDEVNADLTALKWQDEFPVESLQSIPFTNKCSTDVEVIPAIALTDKTRRRRVRKVKERKVFDAIHLTKPRSNNCVKRKRLSEIIDLGRISACLG